MVINIIRQIIFQGFTGFSRKHAVWTSVHCQRGINSPWLVSSTVVWFWFILLLSIRSENQCSVKTLTKFETSFSYVWTINIRFQVVKATWMSLIFFGFLFFFPSKMEGHLRAPKKFSSFKKETWHFCHLAILTKRRLSPWLNFSWLYKIQLYTQVFIKIINLNFIKREQVIFTVSSYNSHLKISMLNLIGNIYFH